MTDKVLEATDLLFTSQPKVERTGYPLHTREDWQKIVEEWANAHPDWNAAQLYVGIKYYNYMFPDRVDLIMISNALNWEK